MSDKLGKKISGFFQWYDDLYGKNYYVNQDNIKKNYSSANRDDKKISLLQQFEKEIENCSKCPLYKTRTNFVFGTGNEDANIIFVGEAPGRNEDLQGKPFVGEAGQLLNKLLMHIHLKRSDVYIANILKSRPPNNRDPLPEEVEACIPYLHRQIEIIKPKLLVALGRIAAQNLLNTSESLAKLRKKIWTYRDIPLIVTYHPAAILRNSEMLDSALDDFRFVQNHSKSL